VNRLKVYFSPLAELKLELIIRFLTEEWSLQSKEKFLKKLKEKIEQISTHPLSCPESSQLPGIHKAVVETAHLFLL
jgi:plasmid stabilization system protein ParE